MAKKKKTSTKKIEKSLEKEYQDLMSSFENSFVVPVQWSEEGDQIEKFSLYENYTPVRTSGETSYSF